MKNVTISMDEETATWTRVQAARANKSVSKYIAELLDVFLLRVVYIRRTSHQLIQLG